MSYSAEWAAAHEAGQGVVRLRTWKGRRWGCAQCGSTARKRAEIRHAPDCPYRYDWEEVSLGSGQVLDTDLKIRMDTNAQVILCKPLDSVCNSVKGRIEVE